MSSPSRFPSELARELAEKRLLNDARLHANDWKRFIVGPVFRAAGWSLRFLFRSDLLQAFSGGQHTRYCQCSLAPTRSTEIFPFSGAARSHFPAL